MSTIKLLPFDLETDGLDVHTCKILGVAIGFGTEKATYVAFKDEDAMKNALQQLKPFFENPAIPKIGHNLKFDINVLRQYGIRVRGVLHDTMVADYILYPNRKKHGLKLITELHLNYKQIEFDDIAKNDSLVGVDPTIVCKYACEDIDLTYQLKKFLYPKVIEQGLEEAYKLDNELVHVIAEMEYNGVLIDTSKLLTNKHEFVSNLKVLKQKIDAIIGGDVNINSSQQLNTLLFDKLAIEPIGKKGKSGYYSTSANNLKKLIGQHPIIQLILEYKGFNKILSTFIPALQKINLATGRLHCSFNQTVTETGRLSCSSPNLQNIPSRGKGSFLRDVFIASNGHVLIGVDYSNIELRVMADFSQDKSLLHAYHNGKDVHDLTASKVLDIPFDQVDKNQRNMAKTVNFGLIYGMTAHGLSIRLTEATGEIYSKERAQEIINQYFLKYDGVASCKEQLIYQATCNEYAKTLIGRKRPLPFINSSKYGGRDSAKRAAMNTPIQGTAADIMKQAMVNIHKRMQKEKLASKILLTVHDELLFEVPEHEVEYMSVLIKHEMEGAYPLSIPLTVDLKVGKTWAEVH